jgi:hypothetical protein
MALSAIIDVVDSPEESIEPTVKEKDFTGFFKLYGGNIVLDPPCYVSDIKRLNNQAAAHMRMEHERDVKRVKEILASNFDTMPHDDEHYVPTLDPTQSLYTNPRWHKKFQHRDTDVRTHTVSSCSASS